MNRGLAPRHAVFFLSFHASAGCGTTFDVAWVKEPQQIRARRAEDVDLFISQNPQRPYAEVAFITARQESVYSFDESSGVLLKLREYAGRMGCDGLIVVGTSNEIASSGLGRSVATLHGHGVVCTHYTDDARAATR